VLALFAASAVVWAGPTPASADILPGVHQVENRWDHLCLDVMNAYGWNGAEVVARRCVNGDNQRWSLDTPAAATSVVRVAHSGKCLTVQWSGNGYGSNVVQDECATATRWSLSAVDQGWSEISTQRPADNGGDLRMCLDKSGWDVTVWDCNGNYWQHWQSLG
jgi:hypothetical protein